jgi:dTDP-4-amino-4,6-dideoxygalactose transaminase
MLLVAEPIVGQEEKDALSEVIDSGWLTMGERVRAFELAFAAKHRAADSVAVNSCTAGLHLALAGLGIGPGDEVLVPSLTFVATINAVLYVGAKPVFVDIEELEEPLISLADAAAKCTPRTRAVIVMHYAGYLVDRNAWREFANSRGLSIIEDTAHAIGIEGSGTIGDVAAFSFYGNKNMTTAEGGVVFAKDPEVLERIRQMRGHGMTSGTHQRFVSRLPTYDVTMLGYNYRMDELRAAIGLTQLRKLDSWNRKRKHLTEMYRAQLQEQCLDVVMPFSEDHTSSYHIMPVLLPRHVNRDRLIGELRDAGVQTTVHYPPAHQLSYYRDLFPHVHLPRTEEFARRELTLPLHPLMGEEQVSTVMSALAKALVQVPGETHNVSAPIALHV